MKPKHILIGGVIVACLASGIFAVAKFHRSPPAADNKVSAVQTDVSVQVGALKRVALHHYVPGYGTVEGAPATASAPAADAPLAPATAGVVVNVHVVAGQQVNQGDVLMDLNSGTVTFANAQARRPIDPRAMIRADSKKSESFIRGNIRQSLPGSILFQKQPDDGGRREFQPLVAA